MFHLYRNKREKFVLSSADIQPADTVFINAQRLK